MKRKQNSGISRQTSKIRKEHEIIKRQKKKLEENKLICGLINLNFINLKLKLNK